MRADASTGGRREPGLERSAEVRAGDEVAMWAVEGVREESLGVFCLGYAGVELGDLAFGERGPARAPAAACGQQLTDLLEREARVLVEADESDAFGARGRIVAFPAGALSGGEQPEPLVVAQRRRRRSGAAGQLADRKQGVVVGHRLRLDLKCASTCTIWDPSAQEES